MGVLQCLGGFAMCGAPQFKEGSCFTVGVLPCVFGGPAIRGAPSWRSLSLLEEEILAFLKSKEGSRHAKGSFSACRVLLHLSRSEDLHCVGPLKCREGSHRAVRVSLNPSSLLRCTGGSR